VRCLTFINADMGPGRPSTLRIRGSRIAALGGNPQMDDLVVDLAGDRLLPGLINAHDHLQLNCFGLPEYGRHYANAGEWIADINARMMPTAAFIAARAIPRDERLLHGGLKNLLSGVTTVAHHDPLYPVLSSDGYPLHVLQSYGWSHSLGIDGDDRVQDSYRHTPGDRPWIIHAAEGVDADARAEFDRLDALGCLGPNTLLVHGVALDETRRARLVAAGAGLIWCPTSNLRLFGATADVADLIARGHVALGSDSRITGGRDLLEEVGLARELAGFDESTLEALVTDAPARLLRLPDRGVLRVGARADILILPAGLALSRAARAQVRLVMSDGEMRLGDPDLAEAVLTRPQGTAIRVDGCTKIVARTLLAAPLRLEPGVELPDEAGRAA
jgi:cytosine/adenosine deaminase-related metal-dependent hydrolase